MEIPNKCPNCGAKTFKAHIPTYEVAVFDITVNDNGDPIIVDEGDFTLHEGDLKIREENINYIYCEECDEEIYCE